MYVDFFMKAFKNVLVDTHVILQGKVLKKSFR